MLCITRERYKARYFKIKLEPEMRIRLWRVENHTTNRWTINYLCNIYMETLYLVPFRHIFSVPRSLVRSVAYGKSEVKLFVCWYVCMPVVNFTFSTSLDSWCHGKRTVVFGNEHANTLWTHRNHKNMFSA
jgi:hypothetical protein